ncbi:MAG: CSLREA domain-containing protein, partial [Thermoanaerobaculia bacterium]|nr:CSLREA domain-containing protein [Thermoanaerobaculia bacterium]
MSSRRISLSITITLVVITLASSTLANTITVDTLSDVDAADGHCSLREALVAANTDAAYRECSAGSGADEILLNVVGTIPLGAALAPITESLTIRGLGSDETIVDGGDQFRILDFPDGAAGNGQVLRIEDLQFTRGFATVGGAIFCGRNRTLEIVDTWFLDNASSQNGGAVAADIPDSVLIERGFFVGNTAGQNGGGVNVFAGPMTVAGSTFSSNVASLGGGGIHIHTASDLQVWQSTFSGNHSNNDGGGILMVATSGRIDQSTLVDNQADYDGDDDGNGGGLSISGANASVTLAGSVLASNEDLSPTGTVCPEGHQKLGATALSDGFNLVGANDCIAAGFPAGQPNVHADLVGTLSAPIDPLLLPIADNGGPMWTRLPEDGSPLVDQGSCPATATDQRGFGNQTGAGRAVDYTAI